MATLFLVRHGEPELRGVFLGQLDPPLSTLGKNQVREALQKLSVQITYTSPLRRARETADYLHSEKRVDLSALRELDYGEWTGKTWAEVEADWPELASRKAANWLGIPAPGGESWTAFQQRLRPVWDLIRQGPHPAAVVAHQGVNAALANWVDSRDPLHFAQNYGEVISLDYPSAND